ncbi:caspase family protein [Seonamhaeicola sp. ML3]|uniref:caspase family protein n=1 Tax=Seonamhaeicola sp. ML3 TaxID=2937786 RepID=UPI00200FB6D1|nr:caspase family protein [Seonamhaeicola sp. ML3]
MKPSKILSTTLALLLYTCFTLNAQNQKVNLSPSKGLSISSFDVSSNGTKIVVSISPFEETIVYDVFSGNEIARLSGYQGSSFKTIYYDNLRERIVVVHDLKVDVWDSNNYQLLSSFDKPNYCWVSHYCELTGELAFLQPNSITVLNIESGNNQLIPIQEETNYTRKIRFSGSGNQLVYLKNKDKIGVLNRSDNFSKVSFIKVKNVEDFTVSKTSLATLQKDENLNASFQFFQFDGSPSGIPNLTGRGANTLFNTMQSFTDELALYNSYDGISLIAKSGRPYTFNYPEGIEQFKFIKNVGFVTSHKKYLDFKDFDGRLLTRIYVNSFFHASMVYNTSKKVSEASSYCFIGDKKLFFIEDEHSKPETFDLESAYINKYGLDKNVLAFGSRDGKLHIWDLDAKKKVKSIVTNKGYPQDILINKWNGLLVASYHQDKTIDIYNYKTNTLIKKIQLEDASPSAMAISDYWLCLGTSKGDYYSWKLDRNNVSEVLVKEPGLGNAITSLEIIGNESYLGSFGRILKAPLEVKLKRDEGEIIKGHNGFIESIKSSRDGKYLASTSRDGTTLLWDTKTGYALENFKTDSTWTNQLLLNDELIVLGNGPGNTGTLFGDDALINKLENPNPELVIQSSNASAVRQMQFSPNGKLIASSETDKVYVREVNTGFLISEFTTSKKVVNDFAFDREGKSIIVATGNGVEFIDPFTGKSKKNISMETRGRSIHHIDVFPDRNSFVVNNIHGWHPPLFYHSNSGAFLGELNINPNRNQKDNIIFDVKISTSGKMLATYGSHFIKVFEVDSILRTKQILAIPRKKINGSNTYWNNYLDFSDDSQYLSYVEMDQGNNTVIYDIKEKKELYRSPGKLSKFGQGNEFLYMNSDVGLSLKKVNSSSTLNRFYPSTNHYSLISAIDYDSNNKLFATADIWGNTKVWNANTGKTLNELNRFDNYVYSADVSTKGDYIAYNNKTGIYLFDLRNFKVIKLKGNNYPYFGAFSKQGDMFYYRNGNDYMAFNLLTQKVTKLFDSGVSHEHAKGTQLSRDGAYLMFVNSENNHLLCYNISKKEKYFELNLDGIGDYLKVSSPELVDSNKKVIRATGLKNINGKQVEIELFNYNIETKKLDRLSPKRILNLEDKFKDFYIKANMAVNRVSPNEKYYAFQDDYHLKIHDLVTKNIIYNESLKNITNTIVSARFSSNSEYLILAYQDGKIRILSIPDFKEVKRFYGATGGISDIDIKSHFLMVLGTDNKINVYDFKQDFKLLYTSTFKEGGEFLIANKEGFYYATKGTIKSVAFKKDEKIYPFEQFDLYYNRPDKALENLVDLGIVDSVRTKAYRQAYFKRISKMGFEKLELTKELHIPEIEIKTANIPVTLENKNFTFEIKAKDSVYNLNRINLWVNDIPVYGRKGKSLKPLQSKEITQNIDLTLIRGGNRIQVSVTNDKGVESLRKTFNINHVAPKAKSNLYVISIGVSNYLNSDYNLKYAKKDAIDVGSYFQSLSDKYATVNNIKILNENATTENILKVKDTLENTKPNDIVIVFFAGHGVLDKHFDYYLATHDMNFDAPDLKGLAYEDLESLLDGIPARKKILLLDACHSGEIDKDNTEFTSTTNNNGNIKVAYRGSKAKSTKKANVGLKNSFELMKLLFADLRKGTGAMVISSASGVEFAYEGDKWQNGVFTYALLEGLRSEKSDINGDGVISISEIKDYVGNEVSRLTNGLQNPTSRAENLEWDWKLY